MTPASWAAQLAGAIELKLASHADSVRIHRVTATSPDQVEVVYTDWATKLRGFRISVGLVRSAPERIRASDIAELAFDIVITGVCEPRPASDFLPPDEDGVSWLSATRWVEEIT